MSDSPASRPKRSSAFVSFYIDEDDFEDDDAGLRSNRSKKTENEDIFFADKYKSSDSDSGESEEKEFESKPVTKIKQKPIKKQNSPKAEIPKKSKSTPLKNLIKSSSKTRSIEEDDFELVVEGDVIDDCEPKTSSRSKNAENENFDEETNCDKLKSKPSIKRTKLATQSKNPVLSAPKSEILSARPKFSYSIEKVKIPGQCTGPRRVGLSKSAPTRPLSPVKLKKFDL